MIINFIKRAVNNSPPKRGKIKIKYEREVFLLCKNGK